VGTHLEYEVRITRVTRLSGYSVIPPGLCEHILERGSYLSPGSIERLKREASLPQDEVQRGADCSR